MEVDTMQVKISKRMMKPDFQADFIAGILKAAADPTIISFAGGLPNPASFPIEAMEAATKKVLERDGVRALQYNSAQGFLPLREFICKRYKKIMDLDFDPSEIILDDEIDEQ